MNKIPDYEQAENWDEPDAEQIQYDCLEEAVGGYIDYYFPEPIIMVDGEEDIRHLPMTITLHGYARMEAPDVDTITAELLDWIDEYLMELHRDPFDNGSALPKSIREASREFARVVHRDYPVYAMEPVCSAEINVCKWLNGDKAQAVTITPGYPYAK